MPDAAAASLATSPGGLDVCVVFDIGKTNTKASVIDADGQILTRVQTATPYLHTRLYAAIDVDTLFDWFVTQLKRLGGEYPIGRIISVAHGAACAFLDAEGQLVQPVQDYESSIPLPYLNAYRDVRPDFAETLSPLLPNGLNLGAQIFWHARRDPKLFEKVRYIVPYAQYWTWRLSGVLCSEITSLGCHTDLWNPNAASFSSLAVSEGWAERFPPLRKAWETAGQLRPDLCAITGLPETTRICVGLHDSNAALALIIARHSDLSGMDLPVILTTGTWYVAMAPGRDTPPPPEDLNAARDCLINIDVFGHAVPCARFMGGRALDLITNGLVDADVSLEALNEVILSGAMALPSFVDAGGPFPGRRGEIRGLQNDTPETRMALGLIYVALISTVSLEMITSPDRPLLIEGPAAQNTAFCTLMAALRTGDVFFCDSSSGVTRGAGAMAFLDDHTPPPPTYHRVEPQLVDAIAAYRARWLTALRAR